MAVSRRGGELDFDVEHLAATVHAVGGVHAVGHEDGAVRVLGHLRGFEAVGAAPEGAASLGLFAFWIGHGGGFLKKGSRKPGKQPAGWDTLPNTPTPVKPGKLRGPNAFLHHPQHQRRQSQSVPRKGPDAALPQPAEEPFDRHRRRNGRDDNTQRQRPQGQRRAQFVQMQHRF